VWSSTYEGHIDGHEKELQLISHLRAFGGNEVCIRGQWTLDMEPPIFTQDRDFIEKWVQPN